MTKEELYTIWQKTVEGTVTRVHNRYPETSREDIEQECWTWIYANRTATKYGPRLRNFLAKHARKYARREAQELDQKKRTKRLYTDREMAVFLEVILQPKLYDKAQPTWHAWLREIGVALSQLSEYDQQILSMRYGQRLSLRQIGERVGKSTATADRHVWEAIGHLQDVLEEPPEEAGTQYVGTGGTISNAKARHIIGRNDGS